MATFLSSALALALVVQATGAPAAPRDRVAPDSADGAAWLTLGRGYLARAAEFHRHADSAGSGTLKARVALDSADFALGRAGAVLGSAAAGDSARALQVSSRGARALLVWEEAGADAAAAVWSAEPSEARLPPLLEELGENLLRACPQGGVLLTAGAVDTDAAWYMHFGRGLRRDLVIVPLDLWRTDPVFRGRVTTDLRVPAPTAKRGEEFPWLRVLVEQRPVCASMAFDEPPAIRRGLDWKKRPLLWVAGARTGRDDVPARDFVFAALRMGADSANPWLTPVLEVYRRAVHATRGLCEPLRVYGVGKEAGCR